MTQRWWLPAGVVLLVIAVVARANSTSPTDVVRPPSTRPGTAAAPMVATTPTAGRAIARPLTVNTSREAPSTIAATGAAWNFTDAGAAAVTCKVSGTLKRGARGDDVTCLQRALNSSMAAGSALRTDGAYGPTTAAAVRAFQDDRSLTVDGVAGPATLRELGVWQQRTSRPVVKLPGKRTPRTSGRCHPSYRPCVPNSARDLDCPDIEFSVEVIGPDVYRFDADGDGTGCDWN